MRTPFLPLIALLLICVYTQASAALNPVLTSSSVTSADIQKVGDHVGKIQSTPSYPAPTGYEAKGFVGSVVSEIFDPIGKILSDYVMAFQNIINVANTVPVWNATTKVFDESNIYSVGGMIGIGETSPSSMLDVSGNISATAYCNSDGNECFTIPMFCDGSDQGLGWDGSNWTCNTMSGGTLVSTFSDCTLDGVTVLHGNSRNFFNTRTSLNCSANDLNRSCNDGTLDGSSSFQYASCSTSIPTSTSGPWSTGTWSICNASCDGGTQTRSVTCIYDTCTGPEPSSSRACNTQSCIPSSTIGPWEVGTWSSCSVSCGGGTQTRTRFCGYDSCTGSTPSTSRSCNTQTCNIRTNPRVDCTSYAPPHGSPRSRTVEQEVASWYSSKSRCPDTPGYNYWVGQLRTNPTYDTGEFWRGMMCSNRFDTNGCNSEILCPSGYEYIPMTEYCRPE